MSVIEPLDWDCSNEEWWRSAQPHSQYEPDHALFIFGAAFGQLSKTANEVLGAVNLQEQRLNALEAAPRASWS
jgi:hypothetical protein